MSHIFNNTITPIKLGIKFSPPSLVLVYRDKSKLRSRQMPAKNLDILTDVRIYVQNFKNDAKNKTYLDKVTNLKLEKLIFMLQDNMKGFNLDESIDRASKKYNNSSKREKINEEEDENLTETKELFSDSHAFDQNLERLKNEFEDEYEMDEDEDDDEDKMEIKKQIDDLRASGEMVAKAIQPNDQQSHDEETDSEVKEEIKEEIDNDFHDTSEEEEEKNLEQSVSTISDNLKAAAAVANKNNNNNNNNNNNKNFQMSKSSALDLLSSHIKIVKSNIYDFEEEDVVEDEEEIKTENNNDDKFETADNSNSNDSSF